MEKTPAPHGAIEPDLGLAGTSRYMQELRQDIMRVAGGDFPVLIRGDSGTGKDVIAYAIHRCGKRKARPLVVLNCAAIPAALEEEEFFGAGRGGFIMGAFSGKRGAVESADGSTLFLDDVDGVSGGIQAKLLRLIDNNEFAPAGTAAPKKADVRILSSTNRNLEELVKQAAFREDLFFRLKGTEIATRPLSQHAEDIPALVERFLAMQDSQKTPHQITPQALALLTDYAWPGNIRELKYTVEVLCIASIGMRAIGEKAVRSVLKINRPLREAQLSFRESKAKVLHDFEVRYFTRLLNKFDGNLNRAAKAADMYRPNLLKKLKEHNLAPNAFRPKKKPR
jgi:DNA-binding NtrC family response regulator